MIINVTTREMTANKFVGLLALAKGYELLSMSQFLDIVNEKNIKEKTYDFDDIAKLYDGVLRIVDEGDVFFVFQVDFFSVHLFIVGAKKDCEKIARYFNLENDVGAEWFAKMATGVFLHIKNSKPAR